MLNLNKTNYVVAEDFDGTVRAKGGIFTIKKNAEESLKFWKENYERLISKEESKVWIEQHQVSEPYLLEINFKKL